LHEVPSGGPIKREGDRRSPSGVYALDTAFGAAPELPPSSHGFPYAQMRATSYCVEDQRSEHYNRLIDSTTVAPAGWERWSQMARPDGLFDWGIVVRQNSPDIERGAGSCVFLHIWRGPNKPTAGCTALPKDALIDVLRWLDPSRRPHLVQLPDKSLAALRSPWGLP
jgi:D-alanyl-D-alanine dipeptidase